MGPRRRHPRPRALGAQSRVLGACQFSRGSRAPRRGGFPNGAGRLPPLRVPGVRGQPSGEPRRIRRGGHSIRRGPAHRGGRARGAREPPLEPPHPPKHASRRSLGKSSCRLVPGPARAVGHQRRRVCLALPPHVAVHGAMAHARVPPRRRRDSRLRAVSEQRPRREREWKRMDAPARPVTGRRPRHPTRHPEDAR